MENILSKKNEYTFLHRKIMSTNNEVLLYVFPENLCPFKGQVKSFSFQKVAAVGILGYHNAKSKVRFCDPFSFRLNLITQVILKIIPNMHLISFTNKEKRKE